MATAMATVIPPSPSSSVSNAVLMEPSPSLPMNTTPPFLTRVYAGSKRSCTTEYEVSPKKLRQWGIFRPRIHLRVSGPRKSIFVSEPRYNLPESSILGRRKRHIPGIDEERPIPEGVAKNRRLCCLADNESKKDNIVGRVSDGSADELNDALNSVENEAGTLMCVRFRSEANSHHSQSISSVDEKTVPETANILTEIFENTVDIGSTISPHKKEELNLWESLSKSTHSSSSVTENSQLALVPEEGKPINDSSNSSPPLLVEANQDKGEDEKHEEILSSKKIPKAKKSVLSKVGFQKFKLAVVRASSSLSVKRWRKRKEQKAIEKKQKADHGRDNVWYGMGRYEEGEGEDGGRNVQTTFESTIADESDQEDADSKNKSRSKSFRSRPPSPSRSLVEAHINDTSQTDDKECAFNGRTCCKGNEETPETPSEEDEKPKKRVSPITTVPNEMEAPAQIDMDEDNAVPNSPTVSVFDIDMLSDEKDDCDHKSYVSEDMDLDDNGYVMRCDDRDGEISGDPEPESERSTAETEADESVSKKSESANADNDRDTIKNQGNANAGSAETTTPDTQESEPKGFEKETAPVDSQDQNKQKNGDPEPPLSAIKLPILDIPSDVLTPPATPQLSHTKPSGNLSFSTPQWISWCSNFSSTSVDSIPVQNQLSYYPPSPPISENSSAFPTTPSTTTLQNLSTIFKKTFSRNLEQFNPTNISRHAYRDVLRDVEDELEQEHEILENDNLTVLTPTPITSTISTIPIIVPTTTSTATTPAGVIDFSAWSEDTKTDELWWDPLLACVEGLRGFDIAC